MNQPAVKKHSLSWLYLWFFHSNFSFIETLFILLMRAWRWAVTLWWISSSSFIFSSLQFHGFQSDLSRDRHHPHLHCPLQQQNWIKILKQASFKGKIQGNKTRTTIVVSNGRYTFYQIPLSNTFYLSNTFSQISFIKYHLSNTICSQIFF